MVRCVNEKCQNHESELEEKTESCPLCGTQTEHIASKTNFNLGLIAILAALASVIIFWSSRGATMWAGATLSVASVVIGLISKNKAAVIISILSLLAISVPLTIGLLDNESIIENITQENAMDLIIYLGIIVIIFNIISFFIALRALYTHKEKKYRIMIKKHSDQKKTKSEPK